MGSLEMFAGQTAESVPLYTTLSQTHSAKRVFTKLWSDYHYLMGISVLIPREPCKLSTKKILPNFSHGY